MAHPAIAPIPVNNHPPANPAGPPINKPAMAPVVTAPTTHL